MKIDKGVMIMLQFIHFSLKERSLFAFLTLFILAIFTIGGCNDSNNGGVDDPETSSCTALMAPCEALTIKREEGSAGSVRVAECIPDVTTCAFNINNFLSQVQMAGVNVSEDSTLWIEAWGGDGGSAAENGGSNSNGGYSQTTTSISDIKNTFNDSDVLFYFLGAHGGNAPGHCGGGGGAATIVAIEDLTLNPKANPTESLVLMVAGGGGGATGGTIKGCINEDGYTGGGGGVVAAGTDADATAPGGGCNSRGETPCGGGSCGASNCTQLAQGGGVSGDSGGILQCCAKKQNGPTNGVAGVGGIGGQGGKGTKCTQVGIAAFRNASLSFSAGNGGAGGGGDNACTGGGGGGGGGYGGGGGGGLGNDNVLPSSGGGGGSFAVQSTKSTTLAPVGRPGNPCGTSGCLTINIIED